jgi:regulatory protein
MTENASPIERKRRGRKPPKPLTKERLEKAALAYLERYASSAANLRRVLTRRAQRSAGVEGSADLDTARGWIEALVARYQGAGLLDDRAYAEAQARSARRLGRSRRAIGERLKAKGIDAETASAALTAADEDAAEPDREAALAFARRRRIGPFRKTARAEHAQRDMAALARAGFSYDIARDVIGGAPEEEP